MSDRKYFCIEVERQENLTVDEIWPDGDAPENPTVEDVIKQVRKSSSVRRFLSDWNIEPSVYVNGKDADLS